MIASVTLFIIALVGIGTLLISKYIENRTGTPVFLPKWIQQREETVRQTTHYILKKVLWFVGHHARTGLSLGKERSLKLVDHVRSQEIVRFKGTLKKNGSASMYLKRIAEHKATLRDRGE